MFVLLLYIIIEGNNILENLTYLSFKPYGEIDPKEYEI